MGKSINSLTTKSDIQNDDRLVFTRREGGIWRDYGMDVKDFMRGVLQTDTYANIATEKTNEALVDGAWYYLSDKYIYLRAVGGSDFAITGAYNAYNADYQGVGDYSGVTIANGFTVDGTGTSRGIWYAAYAGTLNAGDTMIYRNVHYLNLLGAIGTAPDGDTTNWEVISATTSPELRGYMREVDEIFYDFDADDIVLRRDTRGNEVRLAANIAVFPWGNDSFTLNYIEANSTITNLYDFRGTVGNCRVERGTLIGDSVVGTPTFVDCHVVGGDTLDMRNSGSASIYRYLGQTIAFSKKIATADVLTLNGTPVKLIDSSDWGSTTASVVLLDADMYIDFVSAAYATNTTLVIYSNTSAEDQATGTNFLAAANDSFRKFTMSNTDDNIVLNQDELWITASGGNPATGDSDVVITGTVKFIAPELA